MQASGTQTQVFSWEFCKTFENSFFIEHLRWLLWLIRRESSDLSYLRTQFGNGKMQNKKNQNLSVRKISRASSNASFYLKNNADT